MKRFSPCLLVVILILVFSNSSLAQFPCNPGDSVGTSCCGADSGTGGYSWDLGVCDTLYVEPWPETDTCFIVSYPFPDTICINEPGEEFPCFLYINLFVTHDSNTFWWEDDSSWIQDSLAAFVNPLLFWHQSTGGDSLIFPFQAMSWNNPDINPYLPWMDQSMFRHFVDSRTGDTVYYNRMLQMVEAGNAAWNVYTGIDSVSSAGDSGHVYLMTTPLSATCQRWWEGERVLLATLTFKVPDTMHVCFDSTFWPPSNELAFTRYDAVNYFPRHNLPFCIWVGPPRIEVISPNGGEDWCVGDSHDITWLSEKFTDDVKIQYSTNGGGSWIDIISSTENDGVYSWTVPNTPSTNCLVRIYDAADGDPYDESNAPFTISDESITVTYPNGGEVFVAGVSLSITWNSICFTGTVDIFISEDGGANWDPVVSGTENDGVHETSIPHSYSTDQGLVKVSDSDDGDPSDQSDVFFTVSNFTIRAQPETLIVPISTDTTCTVILESQFGFSLPCTLTLDEDSLPANTTYDFNPATLAPTGSSILTFHTDASTPPGTSTVIITGTEMPQGKDGIEHSTQVVLIVPPPDFSIEAEPETVTVVAGESIYCDVILESIYGFSSPCTLTLDEGNLPANTTYDFNPATVVPTDTSILTFYTERSTPPGTSTIIITGTEMSKAKNGIEHSTQVVLIVTPPPDFTIEAAPETLIVITGESGDCDVILESLYGFSSPCTLTLDEDSLPANTTYDFDPATLVPTGTSVLTFYTDVSTPPGTSIIVVTGTEMSKGGSIVEHSTQVVLIVVPPPDFTIEAEPETLTVVAGESVGCDVILDSLYGFSSSCTLTLDEDSLPASTTYEFDPVIVVPPDTSALTFHTTVSTPAGTSTIIITGTEMAKGKAGVEHSTQVVLIVTPPPPDFTIEAEPETVTVVAGESVGCDVILYPLYGFSSSCTLTVDEDSLPASTTYEFDPVTVVPPDTSVLTFHTTVSTPAGTSTIIITGSEITKGKAGVEHSTQVVLIVTPAPDFTIEAEPETLGVNPGESVNCDVILESLWGFSSPCTLTLEEDSLPANTTYDFNPATLVPTDTSVLTFYTNESTPPGIVTIIITGTEMSKGQKQMEHSTQIVLIVAPPRIEVTSPNGDEHWCIDKTQEITWSSEGVPVPFVKIEYSVNGGTSWETIADNTENDGSYAWTIPDTPSDSCLVKVSDAEDGDPVDESDHFFTIFLAGDCNADGTTNIGDAVYLINYFFLGGPPPDPMEAGDVNLEGTVNIADLVYLLNYLFFEGPPPLC
jgi:hypothetical protein